MSASHMKSETEWSLAFWREVPEAGASSTREASPPACRLAPPQGWAYHAHAHGMTLGLLLGSIDVCKWIYGSHVYHIVRETGLQETESPRAGRLNLASHLGWSPPPKPRGHCSHMPEKRLSQLCPAALTGTHPLYIPHLLAFLHFYFFLGLQGT